MGKGSAPSVAAAAAAASSAQSRGAAASARAQAAGKSLKAGPTDDGIPGGAPAGAGTSGAAGAPNPGGLDLASGGNLAAADASGFRDSFKSLGLKLGSGGVVQRADGSPASPAEVKQLRERIASDPQALMRRPDFFQVLPREKFSSLKGDFAGKPEERDGAFKHIGLTDEKRDFQHTESCDKNLDNDCNKKVRKAYTKGRFVSPEDLNDIHEALHPDDDESGENKTETSVADREVEAADADDDEPTARPSSSGAGSLSIAARLRKLLSGAKSSPNSAKAPNAGAASGGGAPMGAQAGASAPRLSPLQMALLAAAAVAFILLGLFLKRRAESEPS